MTEDAIDYIEWSEWMLSLCDTDMSDTNLVSDCQPIHSVLPTLYTCCVVMPQCTGSFSFVL